MIKMSGELEANKVYENPNNKQMIGELELNKVHCMDCVEGMKKLPENSIDLVVTSPLMIKLENIKEI